MDGLLQRSGQGLGASLQGVVPEHVGPGAGTEGLPFFLEPAERLGEEVGSRGHEEAGDAVLDELFLGGD
ncbi:hypothetical protein CSW42_07240, partial [Thermus scotoductus]